MPFQSVDDLFRALRALSRSQLFTLAAVSVGSLGFLLWLALGSQSVDYRLLYRGLPEDDASKVVEALRAEKIGYRLEDGGAAVYVPSAQVYEARIRLAGKGLPSGGGVGFEVFDRTGFGVTDFVQRVNYRRALQGELARSIEQLESIERARVQVALTERSGFVTRDGPGGSASVVVRLRPNAELTSSQVRGIAYLVASSVEGLKADAVSIVDHTGRLLTGPDVGSGEGGDSGASLEREARLEQDLARRIESFLERTVGRGRVVARVRAEMDWTQTERTEERFDPDGAVARSEQRSTETSTEGGSAVGGTPGVTSNTPDANATGASGGGAGHSGAAQTSETINYEVTKTVSRQVLPQGGIKRLSVAVLVDGKPATAAPGGASGFTPWTPEELKQFEDLTKQAVGFSSERGDRFSIVSAPFHSLDPDDGAEAGWLRPDLLALVGGFLHYVVLVALLFLFARLVVKPLAAMLGQSGSVRLPAKAGRLEAELAGVAASAALGEGAAPGLASGAGSPIALPSQAGPVRGEQGAKAVRGWLQQR